MGDNNEWGRICEVLSNKHRRRLLVALAQEDREINVPEDVYRGGRDLERLQVEFAHEHLPKLETAGYIDWERDEERVSRGPEFERIRPLVELLHENRETLPEGWV